MVCVREPSVHMYVCICACIAARAEGDGSVCERGQCAYVCVSMCA